MKSSDWITDWQQRRDPEISIEVTYEGLRSNPHETVEKVASFLGFPATSDIISRIVEEHSFENVAGRPAGVEDVTSHLRTGVVGDWKNYFSSELYDQFMGVAGDVLKEIDYDREDGAFKPQASGEKLG